MFWRQMKIEMKVTPNTRVFFLFFLRFPFPSLKKPCDQNKKKLLFFIFFTQKIESPLKTVGPPGSLVGTKYIKNSREFWNNPFLFFTKPFPFFFLSSLTGERKKIDRRETSLQWQARRIQCGEKQSYLDRLFFFLLSLVVKRKVSCLVLCRSSFTKKKTKLQLNVPLQTIGHAWAGIRGMPRLVRGWRDIYVPRR